MRFGEYPPLDAVSSEPEYRPPTAVTASDPAPLSATLPGSLQTEMLALTELGVGKPYVAAAAEQARINGTSIEQELIASGIVTERAYYAAIARSLRLPFIDSIQDGAVADARGIDSQILRPTMLRLTHSRLAPITAIVPEAKRISELRQSIARHPALQDSLAIATPTAVRAAVWRAGAMRRVRDTVGRLFDTQPHFSARVVFQGNQGFYAGVIASVMAICLTLEPDSYLLFHVVMTLLYFAALLLRGYAAGRRKRGHRQSRPVHAADSELPVYTVMVALYREAGVTAQLVRTLKRLQWPASLLDIKLVCEEDDAETVEALLAQDLDTRFEIVLVPPMHPRTKPKALTYALAGARGAYLAVYDAEDRPHPEQLREAHARFLAAPADVACLQAPLVIANARESFVSSLFSLEYSALFRGLLPMLAVHRMPLPLGGTSNHFRTDILRAVGAWDPFNVTEDADLGMRLYRLGYRSDVILRQTMEDAPTNIGVWTRQRTRWFKGWLQTWLVMMRDPRALCREMGPSAFCIFHLLIGGMLISSLAHPLILIFLLNSIVAMLAAPSNQMPVWEMVLFAMDLINILGSYAVFLVLGTAAMIEYEKKHIGWRWAAVPFYWMMVSFAAWRAVFELKSNPFFWHKTPHAPSSGTAQQNHATDCDPAQIAASQAR